jgi:hypothetical protein
MLKAEGMLTVEQMARECKVSFGTMRGWIRDPDFKDVVNGFVTQYAKRVFEHGIAQKEVRIAVLQEIHDKLLEVIRARSQSNLTRNDVPGASSGLLAMTMKGVGSGPASEIVEEYKYDDSLIKSLTDIQNQIAEELGQRVKKNEFSGPGGEPLTGGALAPSITLNFVDAPSKTSAPQPAAATPSSPEADAS